MPHAPVLTIASPDGRQPLVFNWGVSSLFGWGLYGLNLMLELADHPRYVPMCAIEIEPSQLVLDPLRQARLAPVVDGSRRLWQGMAAIRGGEAALNVPFLAGLGTQLGSSASAHGRTLNGQPSIGVVFLEHDRLDQDARNRAQQMAVIIAGSSWNEAVLRNNGITSVTRVLQGVDISLFHPASKADLFPGRFVVFSGGKLERRKGQDIVLAAFRAFRQRHPEALLLTAWHSPWSDLSANASGRDDISQPAMGADGTVDVLAWAEANGVPADSVVTIGMTPNLVMPHVIREADVALFPNRCEGGTNLVAMECLACGIPTILSANSGHLDLLAWPDVAIPLQRQTPASFEDRTGWHDSDVEEAVEALETVWRKRAAAARMGRRAAVAMQDLTWRNQIRLLVRAIEPVLD
jgi:glycosyltransferase involved in cell wall biosynthesis